MNRWVKLAIGLIVAIVITIFISVSSMLSKGFSSMDEPSAIEVLIATTMRRYAVPSDLRNVKNPLPLTPEILQEGMAHFADHCANCHGNDGKGETSLGPKFYPKVPDMTKEPTQSQSDGALFASIENGIRLTAMPAFGSGTAESAYGSWSLVHFIRHLPKITELELAAMEQLNPKSPEECQEAAFLAEDGEQPSVVTTPSTKPHQH